MRRRVQKKRYEALEQARRDERLAKIKEDRMIQPPEEAIIGIEMVVGTIIGQSKPQKKNKQITISLKQAPPTVALLKFKNQTIWTLCKVKQRLLTKK